MESSPKMKILSSFTHPHVIQNLFDFFLLCNTKEDILKNVSNADVHIVKVNVVQNNQAPKMGSRIAWSWSKKFQSAKVKSHRFLHVTWPNITTFKGAVCNIDSKLLKWVVQSEIQNIDELICPHFHMPLVIKLFSWMPFFFLDQIKCAIFDPVCLLISMAALQCFFHQLAAWTVEILLDKLTVGGITQTKTKTDISKRNAHFQSWITGCSIVFQRNKYGNLVS